MLFHSSQKRAKQHAVRRVVAASIAMAGLSIVGLTLASCGDGDGSLEGVRPAQREDARGTPLSGGAERNERPDPAAQPPDEEPATPAATSAAPRELLPDLEVMPPRQLYIEGGEELRKIRFSTTVVNTGEGPLDLAGTVNAETGVTTATQRIHRDDGEVVERVAGEFMFHEGHLHWHFEDFTMLELWTYREDGSLDQLKATTGKSTFCAVDEILEYEDLPYVPEGPSFLECGQGVQGLSVGWSDTYTADLIGQELDITGVDEGAYAVRTVADPANRLRETNEDNNDMVVFIDIESGSVTLREGP